MGGKDCIDNQLRFGKIVGHQGKTAFYNPWLG